MAPKYHPTPLSGGDRKALAKELGKARAMANILAAQSAEMRAKGEAMIQQADRLLCECWNERMWSDGDPDFPRASFLPIYSMLLTMFAIGSRRGRPIYESTGLLAKALLSVGLATDAYKDLRVVPLGDRWPVCRAYRLP
jgi:hypothetical protein